MTKRRITAFGLALLLAGGCGSGIAGGGAALQAACSWMPPEDIEMFVRIGKVDRANGWSADDLVIILHETCLTHPTLGTLDQANECMICTTAIVTEVYRKDQE